MPRTSPSAHRLGEHVLAIQLLKELREQLEHVDAPHARGDSLVAAAAVAGNAERVQLLWDAVAAFATAGSRLAETHALTELAAAQRRAGGRAAARESASRAYEQAERIGARPLIDSTRGLLWDLGHRPRRAARTGPGSLTPREQQVATLAANGLSTSQIARELYVTPKTVGSHLSNIYGKLGIRGRQQVAAALSQAADG